MNKDQCVRVLMKQRESLHSGRRRLSIRPVITFFLVAFFYFSSSAVPLRKSLAVLAAKDTVCKVWVIFTDKNTPAGRVSPRALARRARMRGAGAAAADMPVSRAYIAAVERAGGRCANIFKWANAASFVVPSSRLPELAKLPSVRELVPVRSFANQAPLKNAKGLEKKSAQGPDPVYGQSAGQLSMLVVPAAQRYLSAKEAAPPGTGLVIGLFDSGFRTRHRCFSYFNDHNLLLADSDFIDHDNTVADPDSVANDMANPYWHNDEHGSMTLSLIAGYDPGNFMGVAYNARFVLARTEDSPVERHYEEDNWAAAMVWAESLGVDIVSSSLGYNTGFTPPDTDYTFQDMDGKTTIISKAARQAIAFGMIVVNSMGNEDPFLAAPADVDGVVSVGAVDSSLKIADFSDRGPTADGRIKPDCVAQGVDVTVPSIYDPSISYTQGSGTSFAAPVVAGVCGLVLQKNGGDSAAAIRNRLYTSCFFAPGQTSIDNSYGRGVPDAFLACLPYNQTYVTVADSFGHCVAGATVTAAGYPAGTSDSAGYAVVTLGGAFPETLLVGNGAYFPTQVVIAARHSREKVILAARYVCSVTMRDTLGRPVAGNIFWKPQGTATFTVAQTDSAGHVLLTAVPSSVITLYGVARGYRASTPADVTLGERITNEIAVTVLPRPASQFVLVPNVLDIMRKGQQLSLEFTSLPDDPRSYSQVLVMAIRSADGTLVWQRTEVVAAQAGVVHRNFWPDRGTAVAPGVYFFIVKYGGKSYKQKFLVIG
ncbi:MAG TPA: S8 family serine peptidase [Chitinivibrionales bacterium]|nr:S8 family serine peptidase [Chitinivibrionales bacterium]